MKSEDYNGKKAGSREVEGKSTRLWMHEFKEVDI